MKIFRMLQKGDQGWFCGRRGRTLRTFLALFTCFVACLFLSVFLGHSNQKRTTSTHGVTFRNEQDGDYILTKHEPPIVGQKRTLEQISTDNFGIQVGYKHRVSNTYYEDTAFNPSQVYAYFVVSEIGRRFHARYVIDIGCGGSYKTKLFTREFHTIGVDYKVNVANSRKAHPDIAFYEMDLDHGNCQVEIPIEILLQSVVVSADVIEHIRDPKYCYIPLMKYLSQFVHAIVITSPDREGEESMQLHIGAKKGGPPRNPAHVREWKRPELLALMQSSDVDMIYSSYMCWGHNYCENVYASSQYNQLQSICLVLENSMELQKYKEVVKQSSQQISVTVIIHVDSFISSVLEYNCQYYKKLGTDVVILKTGNINTDKYCSGISIYHSNTYIKHDIAKLMTETDSDWFVIIDANEILTFGEFVANGPENLIHFLVKASINPYNFNAISSSVIFIHDDKGNMFKESNSSKLPFKIYSPGRWSEKKGLWDKEKWEVHTVFPAIDVYSHRVRVWKKIYSYLNVQMLQTKNGHKIISDISFNGRNAYPFNLLSVRFHPSFKGNPEKVPILTNRKLRAMYNTYSFIGYWENNRDAIISPDYIY